MLPTGALAQARAVHIHTPRAADLGVYSGFSRRHAVQSIRGLKHPEAPSPARGTPMSLFLLGLSPVPIPPSLFEHAGPQSFFPHAGGSCILLQELLLMTRFALAPTQAPAPPHYLAVWTQRHRCDTFRCTSSIILMTLHTCEPDTLVVCESSLIVLYEMSPTKAMLPPPSQYFNFFSQWPRKKMRRPGCQLYPY
jgi:hypothetical protein